MNLSPQALNEIAQAAPAWAATIFILIGAGYIIIRMQQAQNKWFCNTQKQDDERNKKLLEIMMNTGAANQNQADAIRELAKAIKEVSDDCDRRTEKRTGTKDGG